MQTYWVDAGVRVDLQGVNVVPGVLEEAVVGVEHFMRQEVKPLSCHTSIVQSFLSLELDHQPLAKVFWSHLHDLSV